MVSKQVYVVTDLVCLYTKSPFLCSELPRFYTDFWIINDFLPTVDEMKDAWNLGQEPAITAHDDEKAEYERKKKILTFYCTGFMTASAGCEYWSFDQRPYWLVTDMMDVNGMKKVRVTTTSEAFGLVCYENYLPKWEKGFPYLKANPTEKSIPQYKIKVPATHIYKTKWSSAETGQKVGWDNEAVKALNEQKDAIKDLRKAEADKQGLKKNEKFKRGRELVCEEKNINPQDGPPSKKSKTGNGGSDSDSTVVLVDFEDE